jgi:glycosyltransferase involved in cell wall biosynthesis
MKISDIYCSTSSLEGFSVIMSEAIILGKPIVAFNSCGTDELLDNGKYGMLVENSDEELFNALYKITTNKEILEDYTKRSISRQGFFNKKRFTKNMVDYLTSFLENDK